LKDIDRIAASPLRERMSDLGGGFN